MKKPDLSKSQIYNTETPSISENRIGKQKLQARHFSSEVEKVLRQSEERFRAFVAASSDAVYRMSPDWTEMR